ncbi:uncharacterized protein LOC106657522 [Trichogramma pretiosum]|uniref:Biogenesis of lysosome-related organelles complex 1 subunit 3 n=1 Tax=Trichogramma kaykai TaxID=54128 RepID=A0ABD2WWF4_9HYME|nr:uncharacterized protein LOC106657522 [Trichogramma pretiosum]
MQEPKAVIVSGEAPESDDEVTIRAGMSFPTMLVQNTCGTIQGEALESDDENNSVSSVGYAVDPSTCSYTSEVRVHKVEKSCVKYNSLLHRKLRDCNKSLDRNIRELMTTTVNNAVEQLVDTNKQLVKSELTLQEAVCKMQESANNFEQALRSLQRTLDEDYFHNIKI